MSEIKQRVLNALKKVEDPEIGLNLVDLGLIYDINVDEKEKKISVLMTLTSPMCPLGRILYYGAVEALKSEFPGWKIVVELTFNPPWSPERITEEGREKLKEIFGYDVVSEWISRIKGKDK